MADRKNSCFTVPTLNNVGTSGTPSGTPQTPMNTRFSYTVPDVLYNIYKRVYRENRVVMYNIWDIYCTLYIFEFRNILYRKNDGTVNKCRNTEINPCV